MPVRICGTGRGWVMRINLSGIYAAVVKFGGKPHQASYGQGEAYRSVSGFEPDDIDTVNSRLLKAFTRRFPAGSRILAPVGPGGPVFVTTVAYNNGRIMNLENPLKQFLSRRKAAGHTGMPKPPGERLLPFLPPIVLPGHETWNDSRETHEARLRSILSLNLPLVNDSGRSAAELWKQRFHQVVDSIYDKSKPVAVYFLLPDKTRIMKAIAFTEDNQVVLVRHPGWKPHHYVELPPLEGFQVSKTLAPESWPRITRHANGQTVDFLVAPPSALKPVLSDFEYEKAAFVPVDE